MQFAQANAQTKNCKRACFANADKIVFKKFPNASKKNKIHRHTDQQTQQTMTLKLNTDKTCNSTVDRRPAGNRRLAKKRVQWLIEHSTSYQILCWVDSLVLRNPLLRQAPKRYMLCLDKHTAEKPTQKFILFLPNPFLPTLISTFCIFPNRNPMQKMQKELIFQLFKFI